MVENHKRSLAIIRENLALLKITGDYKIFAQDAFGYIKTYSGGPYDLVIADPPFTLALAHDLALAIGASAMLGPEGVFVIEASSKERMDSEYRA